MVRELDRVKAQVDSMAIALGISHIDAVGAGTTSDSTMYIKPIFPGGSAFGPKDQILATLASASKGDDLGKLFKEKGLSPE